MKCVIYCNVLFFLKNQQNLEKKFKLVFVFSFPQIKRMYAQKQYATEIKAALDLVKSYKEANTNLQLEQEEELKQYTTSKLKQKGHQPL